MNRCDSDTDGHSPDGRNRVSEYPAVPVCVFGDSFFAMKQIAHLY